MQQNNPNAALANQGLMNQMDALDTAQKYRALSSAGLAIGTTANTAVRITNAVTYLLGGVFASKTPAEVAFTPGTHDIAPSASSVQERVYLVNLDGAGNPTIAAGVVASGAGNALLPERQTNLTPIGTVRIAVAAGNAGFTGGTTALNAGQLTVTYNSVGAYGSRFDGAQ